MQKYRFSNPVTVVEVSKSPLDRPEPGNRPTKCDTMERPQNFELAEYLAEKHREKMTNDDAFKKVAGVYNMKWRVLKRNFEYVCWVNDSIKELAIKINNN